MTNEEYLVFEGPFRELARPILERLKVMLDQMGYGPFGEVFETDHDISRGLAFMVVEPEDANAPAKLVEMILVDGAESGFEGVALRMECSAFFSGCVWQPGNYTEDVAITTIEDLQARLDELSQELSPFAQAIACEWTSEHFKNQNNSQPLP